MPPRIIVLNGASSSGKSSIARSLQDRWPRPLLVTGIDTFITGWPEAFTTLPGDDGSPAEPTTGLRIARGLGPSPSWIPEAGEDFHRLMRLVHRAWALIGEGGIDQVIDHVLLDEAIRLDAKDALAGAFWVGVHCSVEEVVRREAARGDRYVGFASGTSAVVHDEMTYDFIVDTTHATSTECAERLFDALAMDPRWDSGR